MPRGCAPAFSYICASCTVAMCKEKKSLNFIEQGIEADLAEGFPREDLRFRFPPEPNGYLHIGHAKSICLNFGLGATYGAAVKLRYDDTNPAKEEQTFVKAIQEDIGWLGFSWDQIAFTSDHFEKLCDWAFDMIEEGDAYVDEQDQATINAQRKTPGEAGIASPYRDRPIGENLTRFRAMKAGELPAGSCVLRAKIDMSAPNMHLRDPIMYRIIKEAHHRTGRQWHIYPTYDWAHGQSDYIEQVSHSLCTTEFENHRPLYDYFINRVYESGSRHKPKQREFARLNLSYTILSKRKLAQLVASGVVAGWDDPRMPTISGLRRRGYTPESIRDFCSRIGISKRENLISASSLEYSIRDHLNQVAPRVMAVLNPVKLVIDNYPEAQEEWMEAENNPGQSDAGSREIPFGRTLYIEREDFEENPGAKYFRLRPGGEVRLKNAYIIKGSSVVKDAAGNIVEIHATYDPDSRSGSGTQASKRRVKGTLHWVSEKHSVPIEVRLYDRLFKDAEPDGHEDKDFMDFINPDSLQTVTAHGEPSLKFLPVDSRVQFQRLGYFCVDPDSTETKKVFNRTVTLRDSWEKIQAKG